MPAPLRHFAIECDDVERAKAFYEAVLGWSIRPWGPPGFYQIFTGEGGPAVLGALQERREPLTGTGNRCCECTFAVEDLDATLEAVRAHGGAVLTGKMRIEGVGELAYIADTESNRIGVMRYDADLVWPTDAGGDASA